MTNTTNDTTPRKRLTDHEWAERQQTGLRPNRGPLYGCNGRAVGWEESSDLAHELHVATDMPTEWTARLVQACVAYRPVVITWDLVLPDLGGRRTIERKTATCMVEHISAPTPHLDAAVHPVRIRISYLGFGHDISHTTIRDVQMVPETTVEFLPVSEEGENR